MSIDDINQYKDDENSSQLDTSCNIDILKNGIYQQDTLSKNDQISIQLCGAEGAYELIEFNDMIPNRLGTYEIKKNNYTCINRKINSSIKNYFLILIKKGVDENCYISQSQKFIYSIILKRYFSYFYLYFYLQLVKTQNKKKIKLLIKN